MRRLRHWFAEKLNRILGIGGEIRAEGQARKRALRASVRAIVQKPALLLALPLVHVVPVDDDDRRLLVTSARPSIATLQADAPHALRVARLLASEHRGTVVMDVLPLDIDLTEE